MSAGIGHNSAADVLRGIVSQIEALHQDRAEINDQVKTLMAEAKGAGFDPKILRIVLQRRKLHKEEREERDALVAVYENNIEDGDDGEL